MADRRRISGLRKLLPIAGVLLLATASGPATAHAGVGTALDIATASGDNLVVDDFSATDIHVDAHSGPDGQNPGGTASFVAGGILPVAGPVSCLSVSGNRAVMTIDGPFASAPGFTAFLVRVVDNGGSGEDVFQYFPDDPEVPDALDCRVGSPAYFGGKLIGRAAVDDAIPQPPVITALEVSPRSFERSKGAEIRIGVSAESTVAFRIRRSLPPKNGGPPPKHSRRFKRDLGAGASSIPFSGTVSGFTLRPGRYTLTARARDSLKQPSARVSTTFRITP